jgi:lysophospholipase L1-like esterase
MLRILLLLSLFLPMATSGDPVPSVVLAGDSTVAAYAKNSVQRGWGEMLGELLDPRVAVRNHAKPGRSTKTFRSEGLWTRTLDDCHPGDLLLIQFGHNDSHAKDKPESTDAATDYAANLRTFVAEARARGIKPVLVTPMHRRTFTPDGKLTDELQTYVNAMRDVASATHTPCVDLYRRSGEELLILGEEGTGDLFCKPEDRTHFSAKGARLMAGFVRDELKRELPSFSAWIR